MGFLKLKKNNIKNLIDIETSLWNLIGNSTKISIPILIKELNILINKEFEDLNDLKEELENLGLFKSEIEKFELSLIQLKKLFEKQERELNADLIKTMSNEEIRKKLQGDSQEFSESSNKINEILKFFEKDLNEILEIKKNRFNINGDFIYDNFTKITWERDLTNSAEINWNEIQNYLKNKNKFIPSREDWWNLVNEIGTWEEESENYPVINDLKNIGFKNVGKYSEFTNEEWKENPAYCWIIDLETGTIEVISKTELGRVNYIKKNN